jgi:phosphoenolpyruvate synthase/pyruvate phosphate dikinase
LTVLFAVVWGVAEMVVSGQVTQDSFTLGNLSALVAAVFAISQARYNMLKGGS